MSDRLSDYDLGDIRHYFLSDLSSHVPDDDIALIDKLFNHIESLEEEINSIRNEPLTQSMLAQYEASIRRDQINKDADICLGNYECECCKEIVKQLKELEA